MLPKHTEWSVAISTYLLASYRFHPGNVTSLLGPLFDGSFGIDTEDLINIPCVDFSTLQYFPDQNAVGLVGGIDLTDPHCIAQSGVEFVTLQSRAGIIFNKPVAVTGFGVLTIASQETFSPFNPNDNAADFSFCTTEEEQVEIMNAVFDAAVNTGVNIAQYQWGESGLNSNASGPVRRQSTNTETSISSSPNDGYAAYSGGGAQGSVAGAASNMASGAASGGSSGGG